MTAYWTGTEIGQLGGYGFKGVTLGVVGSCKDGRMGVYEKGGLWRNRSFPFQISKNLKKISYEPHRVRRNFSQPETIKNLLRKWSRFCKNIL